MTSKRSNVSILTSDNKIRAFKKRQKQEQIKEIVFDEHARREYLTGFHKRNLQKKEAAKIRAKEKERVERLETRAEHRKNRAEQAAKNFEEVERAYGGEGLTLGALDSTGSDTKGKGKAKEDVEEYEDEEQLATVTVVEDFDLEELGAMGAHRPKDVTSEPDVDKSKASRQQPPQASRLAHTKTEKVVRKAPGKSKSKPDKIRYETKAARKVEKLKQKSRRSEKSGFNKEKRLEKAKGSRKSGKSRR